MAARLPPKQKAPGSSPGFSVQSLFVKIPSTRSVGYAEYSREHGNIGLTKWRLEFSIPILFRRKRLQNHLGSMGARWVGRDLLTLLVFIPRVTYVPTYARTLKWMAGSSGLMEVILAQCTYPTN